MAKQVMKPRRTSRLPQAPDMEPRHKTTWIVVADATHARFFEPGDDPRKLVAAGQATMTAGEPRPPSRARADDDTLRDSAAAADDARRAVDPSHDAHKTQKDDFTARVAEVVNRACEEGRFDRLVLVAPARALGELRPLLSARVKKTIAHEVGKDLTHAAPTELRQHLNGMLPPPALR